MSAIGLGKKLILLGVGVSMLIAFFVAQAAGALSPSDFRAGNILSDTVMTNKSSMSQSQIQSFLNGKVPTCDTNGAQPSEMNNTGVPDYNKDGVIQRWEWGRYKFNQTVFPCLKGYTENGKTSARIIYEISQEYSINPQVLIVLLQKEQSLVTDTWPLNIQYRSATGYGCPDTAACDTQYYGFTNQVRWAATMYRAIMNASSTWYTPYVLGENYIQYNPNSSCGGSVVNILNRATQALYNYTPYQPNKATLQYKLGGGPYVSSAYPGCGAFGNINFFTYFTGWFGSTQGVAIYTSSIDASTDTSGEQAVIGFRLSHKPTANVTIPVGISSASNAKIKGAAYVTITPSTWSNPEMNTVTIVGLNNPALTGTHEYSLVTQRPSSGDIRYASLSGDQIEDAPLVHQNTKGARNAYRLYSEQTKQHLFTASAIERDSLLSQGWRSEGVGFSYCEAGKQTVMRLVKPGSQQRRMAIIGSELHTQASGEGYVKDALVFSASSQGNVPIYWRLNESTGDSLYTTSQTEGLSQGYIDKGVAFMGCQEELSVVYRLYSNATNNHLFTASAAERDKIINSFGYRYENDGFYVCRAGDQDVFRLYRKSTNSHFFTTSTSERASAVSKNGFVYEGVAFKACLNGDQDVFRLYRKSTNSHFFTTSTSERASAVSKNGFVYEGVAFKAF